MRANGMSWGQYLTGHYCCLHWARAVRCITLHLGYDRDGSGQRIWAAGVQQSEELHFLLISWQVCAYLSLFDFVTGVSGQHPRCQMKTSSLFYAYHMAGGLCPFLLNMNFATIPWTCVSWRLDDCCHRAVFETWVCRYPAQPPTSDKAFPSMNTSNVDSPWICSGNSLTTRLNF